jgi:kynureninase
MDAPSFPAPPASRAECEALDRADPLAPLRERLVVPEAEIYLDGNSLGPLPRDAPARLAHAITHQWGERLIRSWNEAGWFDLPLTLGERIGALIGAAPGQTVVCDTVSINLHKALHAAMALRRGAR